VLKTVAVSVTPWRRTRDVLCSSSPAFPVRTRTSHPSSHRDAHTAAESPGGARAGRLGALLVLALALAGTSTLAARPGEAAASSRLDGTERRIVKLINSYRARNGRPRVQASGRLNRVADRHSRAMLAHDFFAHASRNGTAAATRVRRSSRARSVGENIAFIGAGQRRAAGRVVSMWINSPGHRAVLLNSSYRRIGVGRRAGFLGGNRGAAFTADFASRR
jgi:uncharacterized protein YkwD